MTFFHRAPVRVKRNQVSDLRRDPLSVFDEFFNHWGVSDWDKTQLSNFTPSLNVKEDDKAYYIEAELAGIPKESIDISIKDNSLVLKGEKKTFNEEKKEDYHHIERSYGSFYRTIPLAKDADHEKISADFENGLLTIEVAKKDLMESGSRKIDIR